MDFSKSPKEFLKRQDELFGNLERQGDPYDEFCKATARLMDTPSGKTFLEGLMRITEFGSSAFRTEDEYNTHAAALRDGAHNVIEEIRVAAAIGKTNKNTDQ